ncbi:hypothetical protein C8R44DRAFT_867057 [Mycena epipterygia]|nr:hypothetical protein C8R44DRAFT_867057 [Mycena epipterygia]
MASQPSTSDNYLFRDSFTHHNRLARLTQYTALASVLTAYGWSRESGRNVLREREVGVADPDGPAPQYAYLVVVGKVKDFRCFCGPMGSWTNRWTDPLSKAKYAFVLECPEGDDVFKAAWAQSVANLRLIETATCPSGSKYFFFNEDGEKGLRFTKNVFERKGDLPSSGVQTATWPVGRENAERLQDVARTHEVQPFPLYNEHGHLVPPTEVDRALPGCLVEVYFRLTHRSFKKNGDQVESMNAEVVQVTILKKGRPKPTTPFGTSMYRPAPSLPAGGPSAQPVVQSAQGPVAFHQGSSMPGVHAGPAASVHPPLFGAAVASSVGLSLPQPTHVHPPLFGPGAMLVPPVVLPTATAPRANIPGVHPPLFGPSVGSLASAGPVQRAGVHPPLFGSSPAAIHQTSTPTANIAPLAHIGLPAAAATTQIPLLHSAYPPLFAAQPLANHDRVNPGWRTPPNRPVSPSPRIFPMPFTPSPGAALAPAHALRSPFSSPATTQPPHFGVHVSPSPAGAPYTLMSANLSVAPSSMTSGLATDGASARNSPLFLPGTPSPPGGSQPANNEEPSPWPVWPPPSYVASAVMNGRPATPQTPHDSASWARRPQLSGSPADLFVPRFDEASMTSASIGHEGMRGPAAVMWGPVHEAAAQVPLTLSGLQHSADVARSPDMSDFIVPDDDNTEEGIDYGDESNLEFYRRVRKTALGKRKVTFEDDEAPVRKAKRVVVESSGDETEDDNDVRAGVWRGKGRGKA